LLDLDTIVAHVIEAVAASDAIDPVAVRFLLAEYAATGRDDLVAIVGAALGRALQQQGESASADPAPWLLLFADAAVWSDDERLRETAAALMQTTAAVDASTIEAVLHAAAAVGDAPRVSAAVDELERLIGRRYEPGDGVDAADQFAVASALLTAFDISGRLPYAMLAEELVQTVMRRGEAATDAESACRAAHVLGRLAALHDDEAYRVAAVVAPGADYRRDAEGLLAAHSAHVLDTTRAASLYGLALAHSLRLH
jgi:hypothetical protein